MSHHALTDCCSTCADLCARCHALMGDIQSFNDCPHCCRACRAVCEVVQAMIPVGGLLFIQSLRLCLSVTEWCAANCSQQADPEFQQCSTACLACRDACQQVLEAEVSTMVQPD